MKIDDVVVGESYARKYHHGIRYEATAIVTVAEPIYRGWYGRRNNTETRNVRKVQVNAWKVGDDVGDTLVIAQQTIPARELTRTWAEEVEERTAVQEATAARDAAAARLRSALDAAIGKGSTYRVIGRAGTPGVSVTLSLDDAERLAEVLES